MAQPGRALGSGPRGRRFKSSRPDHGSFYSIKCSKWDFLANSSHCLVGVNDGCYRNETPILRTTTVMRGVGGVFRFPLTGLMA